MSCLPRCEFAAVEVRVAAAGSMAQLFIASFPTVPCIFAKALYHHIYISAPMKLEKRVFDIRCRKTKGCASIETRSSESRLIELSKETPLLHNVKSTRQSSLANGFLHNLHSYISHFYRLALIEQSIPPIIFRLYDIENRLNIEWRTIL